MSERLDRFINLMRGVFELDKTDLDFGIYRIINIRQKEIEEFLTEGLPKKVQDTLAPFASNTDEIEKRIREIETALGTDVASLPESIPMVKEYRELKSKLASGVDMSALEADVYSALYSFFNRYYDEGDFISKRRYKEGVYAIPYEGEEVKLYWANQDQYYIKTAENFKDYTFIARNTYGDSVTVHFMLVDATTEQNNNKESADSKRTFMLFEETDEMPGVKTFEYRPETNEFIVRFIFDIPEDKKVKWAEKNSEMIRTAIAKDYPQLATILLDDVSKDKKKPKTLIDKHLEAYVAKNTFDYFIHKDLGGFLRRELDFFIKSEVIHLDDLDTADEKRADSYLAKVRAIKRVGNIIIDFLAQIENFQKKLWLKKKFIVETNWCITLDRIDESFWQEIIDNKAQMQEWIEMYAIDDADGWTNPPSVDFLRQNQNLVVDTKHFSTDFKDRLIASFDNLDEQTDGLMINGDNFHVLNTLKTKSGKKYDNVHIDPPYNTDTSGFLYKNNYRHSSWASMMRDRVALAEQLLDDESGVFQCHIDENEYELLFSIFNQFSRGNAGTVIWDKLNPMLGKKGVATQHEYIIFRTNVDQSIYARNENIEKIFTYAAEAIKACGGVNIQSRKVFAAAINKDDSLSGGDKAYHLLDDNGCVYRLVAMGAPEKRTDPKYYIPLIHPVTGKPCPVPASGWSRKPETMQAMIKEGAIIFGKDETTQPQKKVLLSKTGERQLSSVLQNGKSGKADLDRLGYSFPYAHPVSMYETILSANQSKNILDFFAGSGTSGHATLNLIRADSIARKYTLVEMGEYFNNVTLPRMKKVIYSGDWNNGKPISRDTGVSHIMKYFSLESYEDALSNIELVDNMSMSSLFGEDYLLHYMLDTEAEGSLLDVEQFENPFDYKLKINEHNETKVRVVDLVETFNYLIGLTVVRQSAVQYYAAVSDANGEYEGAVCLNKSIDGQYGFKQVEGTLPDGRRTLVIWRTVSDNLLESNAALDAYFLKHRINPQDREFDIIYVNGDSNLENLKTSNESWKVNMTEIEFKKRMFEEE